jgi:MFS transporter, Spinster family, sphingosine-1-phosphate transporter
MQMKIKGPVVILSLLTAINLLNYLDRLVVSAVLPRIKSDLDMSGFEAGLLATIFLIGYFVTSPIFGTLGDRGKRTLLISIGIAIWSLATIASGLATNKIELFIARAIVGVGEASYTAVAPTIIDDLAPPAKKGKWLAIFYAAMPIGAALGYLVGGAVEKNHGWHAAFFVAGAPGLVLAFLCLFIQEPERKTVAHRESAIVSARALFPFPIYRRAVLGYAAFTFAMGGFAYWAPNFLADVHHIELDVANKTFGTIAVVTGVIGALFGGFIGDRAALKNRGAKTDDDNASLGYLRVCMWTTLVGAPLALIAILSPSAGAFFKWTFPAEIALFMSSSPINAVILRSVPVERRASAMALSVFAIHLLGDLWSPPLIGAISDVLSMRPAMFLVPLGFLVAAGIWWMRPPREHGMNEKAA